MADKEHIIIKQDRQGTKQSKIEKTGGRVPWLFWVKINKIFEVIKTAFN